MAERSHRTRQIIALWGMARPLQLLAIALVYTWGVLIARAHGYLLVPQTLIMSLLAILMVAASVHYANEYADHETDALTTRTPFSGGSGVLPRGDVPRVLALQAMVTAGVVGLVLAVVLRLNAVALALLIFIAVFGWMYSLPPLKLAWRGWGELDNALLGGLALPVYGYVTVTATVDFHAVLAALPFALLVFLNLLATTWPDRHADAQVGKYTLATLLTVPYLRLIYGAVALIAFALVWRFHGDHVLPALVCHLSAFVLPLVLVAGWLYTRRETPFFSVAAMLAMLTMNLVGWFLVA
jgi:1,4-dihydroxy-2-naphthoate polyprenyltransferase